MIYDLEEGEQQLLMKIGQTNFLNHSVDHPRIFKCVFYRRSIMLNFKIREVIDIHSFVI